jgi:hypothetical protein
MWEIKVRIGHEVKNDIRIIACNSMFKKEKEIRDKKGQVK